MLETRYSNHHQIAEAIECMGNISLQVEIKRWNTIKRRMKTAQDKIKGQEDVLFSLRVEQQGCHIRLERARAVDRVLEKTVRDQHIYPLTPWSVECGHST
jgi:hypothetical protein